MRLRRLLNLTAILNILDTLNTLKALEMSIISLKLSFYKKYIIISNNLQLINIIYDNNPRQKSN